MPKTIGTIGDHGIKVLLSLDAMRKIWGLTDIADEEWSAIGMVNDEVPGLLIVEEIFLLPQRNSVAHTSLDKDAAGKLMLELFQHIGEDVQKLRCWVHSHGTGTVFWSSQDDKTIDEFIDPVATPEAYLLSLVVNKSREIRARLDTYAPVRLTLDKLPVTMAYYDAEDHLKLKEEYKKVATEQIWNGYGYSVYDDDDWAWYHQTGVYDQAVRSGLDKGKSQSKPADPGASSVELVDDDTRGMTSALRESWSCFGEKWGAWPTCSNCCVTTECLSVLNNKTKEAAEALHKTAEEEKKESVKPTDDDGVEYNCFGDMWGDDNTCRRCDLNQKCCIEYMAKMEKKEEPTVNGEDPLQALVDDYLGCFGEDFDGEGPCKTCDEKQACIQEMVKLGRAKVIGAQVGDPAVVGTTVVGTIAGWRGGDPVVDYFDAQNIEPDRSRRNI